MCTFEEFSDDDLFAAVEDILPPAVPPVAVKGNGEQTSATPGVMDNAALSRNDEYFSDDFSVNNPIRKGAPNPDSMYAPADDDFEGFFDDDMGIDGEDIKGAELNEEQMGADLETLEGNTSAAVLMDNYVVTPVTSATNLSPKLLALPSRDEFVVIECNKLLPT
jgi:hypothetical protein